MMLTLPELVGRDLGAITFVRDYIQLDFDGPKVSFITDPILGDSGKVVNRTNGDFCNVLIRFIGRRIDSILVTDDFVVRFEGQSFISVSLRDVDRKVSPEAVIYQKEDGRMVVF